MEQCYKNTPCILSPPSNNCLEFNGCKHTQKTPFVIYGDTEAFLVPTDSSSSSNTLLNNITKNFAVSVDDDDDDIENLGMEHFVDFHDDDDDEDDEVDEGCDYIDDNAMEEGNILETDDNNSGESNSKKSNKTMPNEEPHRKPLHPWLKTKRLEPTQKKARQDLSAFMEANSVKHEHKLVITFHFFSLY